MNPSDRHWQKRNIGFSPDRHQEASSDRHLQKRNVVYLFRQTQNQTSQTDTWRKESSGSAQTDINWSIQTDILERNVGYQFRQTQSEPSDTHSQKETLGPV